MIIKTKKADLIEDGKVTKSIYTIVITNKKGEEVKLTSGKDKCDAIDKLIKNDK